MDDQYLHSDSRLIRRLSCVAYCAATMAATFFWVVTAHLEQFSFARWFGAVFGAVPVWWIAAGIGLRVVRFVDRRPKAIPPSRPATLSIGLPHRS